MQPVDVRLNAEYSTNLVLINFMLRIGKLTDYGIDLLTLFVADKRGFGVSGVSASELSRQSGVPLPTVSKVCKLLARAGLLIGSRGATGGYRLAHDPTEISLADVVRALEGPIALTDCLASSGTCAVEQTCKTRANWSHVNTHVLRSLESITVADMHQASLSTKSRKWHVQA
ncbi:MAG: SUF system Fe-S cluster assembly regulator [Parcubacteria group bacterium]